MKMTAKRFWQIVEDINWPVICNDHRGYDKAKKNLLKTLTQKEAEQFRDMASEFKHALYAPLFEKATGMGDDGYGDFLCHIIGMGKKEYEKCVKDNDYAIKMYNDNYIENFFYCIPYDDDYTKTTEEYDGFFKWGDRIYRSFEKICKTKPIINAFDVNVAKDIFALAVIFKKFSINKDYAELMKQKDYILKASNDIKEYLEKNKRTLPHILFMDDSEIFESDEDNVETKVAENTVPYLETLKDYGMNILRNEWIIKNLLNEIEQSRTEI